METNNKLTRRSFFITAVWWKHPVRSKVADFYGYIDCKTDIDNRRVIKN